MPPRATMRALNSACLLTLSLLAVTATSLEATPRWIQATPFGGPMVDLEQAPSAPQILYAAAQTGRVFRSLDGGATWQPRAGTPPDNAIVDLFVDPHDPRTVYARTNFPSLLRTRDGARSWSPIAPDLPFVSALALDRDQPATLFAATSLGLYRSLDGGDTWSVTAFADSSVVAVAVDPRDSATLFAALADPESHQAVWKSTDHGTTWTATPLAVVPNSIDTTRPHFVFDPARPGTLYTFFTAYYSSELGPVFRSTDGGASWTELPAARTIRDLVAAPDGILFAATERGISRSSDRGETWVPPLPISFDTVAAPGDSIRRVFASASSPGALLAAGSAGIWKSDSGGANWRGSNQGIVAQGVYSFAVAPSGPATVVALAGSGVYRSGDRGNTWTRVHSEISGPQPVAISVFDPRHPRTIYGVGTDLEADVLVESTNGGRDWVKLPVPYTCSGGSLCDVSMSPVVLDPKNPDAVILGGSYFFHLSGSGGFLLRSDDGFATLTRLTPLANLLALVIDPERHTRYHALTCGHLFQSEDAGVTWRQAGRGLPKHLCNDTWVGRPLALDPRDHRRLYVGTELKGVFASSDGGATFRAMNRGLDSAHVSTILIDPADSTKIYAGAGSRGVFQWNADRGRWLPLNAGLPLAQFGGVIAFDPRQPSVLYAATGEGVFRLDLGSAEP